MTDTNRKKRHHFVPRSYLAGFTDNGQKDGEIWQHSIDCADAFPTTTNEVAYQNHLYRFEGTDVDPDVFEDTLAEIQDDSMPIIKDIQEERKLPDKETNEYNQLMFFLGLLEARNPQTKSTIEDTLSEIGDKTLRMITSSKETWEQTISQAKQDDVFGAGVSPERFDHEKMKESAEKSEIEGSLPQNAFLRIILEKAKITSHALSERKWILCDAGELQEEFITSDWPVSFYQENRSFYGPHPMSSKTNVVIPITKSLALYSNNKIEAEENTTIATNPRTVAVFNSITLRKTMRFAYSPEEDFIVWMDDNIRKKQEIDYSDYPESGDMNE